MSGPSFLEQRLRNLKQGIPNGNSYGGLSQPRTQPRGQPMPGSYNTVGGRPGNPSIPRRPSAPRMASPQRIVGNNRSTPHRTIRHSPPRQMIRDVENQHRKMHPRIVRNPQPGSPMRSMGSMGPQRPMGRAPAMNMGQPQLKVFRPRNPVFKLMDPRDAQEIERGLRSGYMRDYDPDRNINDPYYDKDRVISNIKDKKMDIGRQRERTQDLDHKLVMELNDLEKKRAALEEKMINKENDLIRLEHENEQIEHIHEQASKDNQFLKTINKDLREKLIELGEETNKLIGELDSKLNGVLRLRDHEIENGKFELETADSEFAMICTEMDQEYGEKFKEIEQKIRDTNISKDKGERQLREISERVRNLHRETEKRAGHVVGEVKKEGARNLEDSKNEVNSKLKGIEETTRDIKLKNEEKLKDLHNLDRQFRNTENNLKNEYSRLKMDYDRMRKENRNLNEMSKGYGKQLGEKESEYSRAAMDKKITEEKLKELKELMQDDILKLQTEIAQQESMMDNDRNKLEVKSSTLQIENEKARERYRALKADYDSLMDRLHRGLENTLTKEITGFNKDREHRYASDLENPTLRKTTQNDPYLDKYGGGRGGRGGLGNL